MASAGPRRQKAPRQRCRQPHPTLRQKCPLPLPPPRSKRSVRNLLALSWGVISTSQGLQLPHLWMIHLHCPGEELE